jgi:hypothetical protein
MPRSLLRNLFSKFALGFIPVIHPRVVKKDVTEYCVPGCIFQQEIRFRNAILQAIESSSLPRHFFLHQQSHLCRIGACYPMCIYLVIVPDAWGGSGPNIAVKR